MENKDMSIVIHGLHKSFKDKEVLRGLDLAVPKGSVFALLGQNGAGKTTLVKILSTLLQYDNGEVEVLSHKLPQEDDAVREKISLTGQYVALDEDLSGEQNLIMIARLLGYTGATAKGRANELLKMFDLAESARKNVKTYSGGMHRRLDIAASIIKAPELLFLDEPTTGLDPRSRKVVWDFVRQLAKNGTTIFLTTQYLEEADQLSDLVAVLESGKIVAQGTPTELKNLVGRKTIKIRFQNVAECDKARTLIQGKMVLPKKESAEHEAGILAIEISDISEATAVLNILAKESIEPAEYAVTQATLDEVFMTFTGGKENE